jgi:hypothetical protein
MKTNSFSFSEWLAGKQAVSFTLFVGVIFLISNYQTILFNTNPDNAQELFKYPLFIRAILSHLDSLFFGLATSIIMFQSDNQRHKILYCTFEAIMIFLNLNRDFISLWFGYSSQIWLGTYIAVFSGFTLFFLGNLAKQHRKAETLSQKPENANFQNLASNILHQTSFAQASPQASHQEPPPEQQEPPQSIGFQVPKSKAHNELLKIRPRGKTYNYERINDLLGKGLKVKEVAKIMNCSESVIQRAKKQPKE